MKKTVLVSGGAGFIGSHVTVELIEAGLGKLDGNVASNKSGSAGYKNCFAHNLQKYAF